MKVYVYIILLLFCGLLFFSFKNGDFVVCQLDTETFSATYESADYRLTGKYFSNYKNGNLKSKGFLENGQRKGKWELWDSSGTLVLSILYESPYHYKRIFPPLEKDPTIQLFYKNPYLFSYNENGFIDFLKLYRFIEKDFLFNVLLSKEKNSLFFELPVIDSVCSWINNKKISPTDEYGNAYTFLDSSIIQPNQVKDVVLSQYWLYDDMWMLAQYRPFSLVLFCKTEVSDTLIPISIYYQSLRTLLAKIKVPENKSYTCVNTIDDWFFFRYYTGVLKNIQYQSDYSYSFEETQPHEWEVKMIELEHDIWLKRYKN